MSDHQFIITSAICMDKMADPEKVKKQMIRRGGVYSRMRSYVVKVFASHYFKVMSDE